MAGQQVGQVKKEKSEKEVYRAGAHVVSVVSWWSVYVCGMKWNLIECWFRYMEQLIVFLSALMSLSKVFFCSWF